MPTATLKCSQAKYGYSSYSTNDNHLYVGKYGSNSYRTRLKFPSLTTITGVNPVTVTGVILKLYRNDGGGNSYSFGISASGSWGASNAGSLSASVSSSSGWRNVDMTNAAAAFLQTQKTDFYIHIWGSASFLRFYNNYSSGKYRPYLSVTYEYTGNSITSNTDEATLGEDAVTFTINPGEQDDHYSLGWAIGDSSGELTVTNYTASWAPNIALAAEITDADRDYATVTMNVYGSSNQLLRTEVLKQLLVVPASVKMGYTSYGVSMDHALSGIGLAGKTRLTLAPVLSSAAAYGASVVSLMATITNGTDSEEIAWTADEMIVNGTTITAASKASQILTHSGAVTVALTAEDSRGVEVSTGQSPWSGTLSAYAEPVITGFTVDRYEILYNPDDEPYYEESDVGGYVWVNMEFSCTDVRDGSEGHLNTLSWAIVGTDGTSVSGTVAEQSYSVAHNRTLISAAVPLSATVDYTLTVTDSAGYTAMDYDNVVPGRVNFALAASRYGAAFGGIPKGTELHPMLESSYPGVFYHGIERFATTAAEYRSTQKRLGIQCGTFAAQSVSNSYYDKQITFDPPYLEPPIILCALTTGSTAAGFATVVCAVVESSVSTTGATLRVFNNGSSRVPGLMWIAIGPTGEETS